MHPSGVVRIETLRRLLRETAGTVEALARLRDARTAHEWPVETDDGLDYSRCTCGAKPPYSPGGSEDGFWWAQHHDEALVRAVAAPDAPYRPQRGDEVEAWIKRMRSRFNENHEAWIVLDWLLDDYRLHADTGTPLTSDVDEMGG